MGERMTGKAGKRYLFLAAVLLLLTLTACGSSGGDAGGDWDDPDIGGTDWRTTGIDRDDGTITRDGEDTFVLVCINASDAVFYYDTQSQMVFDVVEYPITLTGDPWEMYQSIDFADRNGDGDSDVTIVFNDGGSELVMVWFWDEESELFTYQPEESRIGNAAAEESEFPGEIEGLPYNSDADDTGVSVYLGEWKGCGNLEGCTLEAEWDYGGMYFTMYSEDELEVSGYAQRSADYGDEFYFLNQYDGVAYHITFLSDTEMEIYSFGTFEMDQPSVENPKEEENAPRFDELDGSWYLNGNGDRHITINPKGQWSFSVFDEFANAFMGEDNGYLERDEDDSTRYYAHSYTNEDQIYVMIRDEDNGGFTWGENGDHYSPWSN